MCLCCIKLKGPSGWSRPPNTPPYPPTTTHTSALLTQSSAISPNNSLSSSSTLLMRRALSLICHTALVHDCGQPPGGAEGGGGGVLSHEENWIRHLNSHLTRCTGGRKPARFAAGPICIQQRHHVDTRVMISTLWRTLAFHDQSQPGLKVKKSKIVSSWRKIKIN